MKKNIFYSKVLAIFIAFALTSKYVFIRRLVPFKSLVKNVDKKPKKLNFSTRIILRSTYFVFKSLKVNSCFTKSLVINEMLSLSGITGKIQIGINEIENEIYSHCWVKIHNFYTESLPVRNKYKVLHID